jgi:ADP-heptose:LPS heptosyltransferase
MRGGRQPGHRLAHLGALLGLDPPPLPVAWFGPAERARAAALLPGDGVWIGLGPTANWDRKVWPADRFVALYRALTAPGAPLEGARAAVLGGPGAQERAMAAPVLAALGEDAVDLVGGLALPEVAAVLARCALFVGNDSGLMHLSAATGTPTLGLFGPSPVEAYAPAGRRTATAVAPGSPGLDSMPGLTLEMALAAAERLLAAKVPA